MIVGGEKYMWVAYGITWGGMLGYLLSLIKRWRTAKVEHQAFVKQMNAEQKE